MRVQVLGPVRLVTAGGDAVEVPERKVRALLAALSASAGEAVPAETLISRVWGEDLPGNPSRVLQAKLSQLRALLDQAAPGGRKLLNRSSGGYRLSLGEQTFDAAAFRSAVGRAAELPADGHRVELLQNVLDLWRGGPYAEFADELWLGAEIADLEETRLRGVELCAEALVEIGRPEQAVTSAAPLLTQQPTREGLAAPLLLAYYRTRRQPEALSAYERLRGHLADEFGADPTPELQRLHLQILRQDPELAAGPTQTGPAQTGPAQAGSPQAGAVQEGQGTDEAGSRLPAYPSPFLGRAAEVRQVSELMAENRLVTLLGIGGVGKTRLAVRAAEGQAENGAEVWFVDLAEVVEGSTVGEARAEDSCRLIGVAAAALGLTSPWQESSDVLRRLVLALEGRDALLVLDNCEHIVEDVAFFTAQLLRRAPQLRILTTSREPLNLPEEQRFTVPPLTAQDTESPAVEFFLTRARAVDAAIDDDPEAAGSAAELCRRLDGLPLALELAAAQTHVLSVAQLLERISDRLDLLARPGRAAPRRQQTLRGMLDWSWSLLQEQEQILLRRLAVHPVSWRLDAVEEICADLELPRRRVLPALVTLVERSLVSTVRADGELRYRLLETVGAYAAEKLAVSGDREAVAGRHLNYHLALVECAEHYLFGPRARDWVRRLDEARPHLNHAIDEALHRGDGAAGVGLVRALFWYRWMTGRVDTLLEELPAVLACPHQGESPEQRRAYAQTLVLARTVADCRPGQKVTQVLAALESFAPDEESQLARMQVQWFAASVMFADLEHRDQGSRLADESIAHLLQAGDLRGAAFASTQRDWFLLDFWGIPPAGLPEGHDAEQILRAHGDVYGLTQALGIQHLWAEAQGRTEEAQQRADEATALCAELSLDGESAFWMLVQSVTSLRSNDLDAAEDQLSRARALAQRTAFVYCITLSEAVGAMLAERRGDVDHARQVLAAFSAEDREDARRTLVRYLGEHALPAELQPAAGSAAS